MNAGAKQNDPAAGENPSAWSARLPVLCAAGAGFCIAMYLSFYQWGVFHSVWEPFFGNGSRTVLHSFISRLLPVPDAFLGALGYLAEIVTGLIGGSARWRMMPWMVLIHGAVVALVGFTALVLAALQPLLFHAGCTLCLTSSAISLCVIWLARREVLAALRHLRSERARRFARFNS